MERDLQSGRLTNWKAESLVVQKYKGVCIYSVGKGAYADRMLTYWQAESLVVLKCREVYRCSL